MFWKKPPPPPKPKLPQWVSIVTPIIFAVIVGLLGIVYTSLAEEVNKKVDNETLQLLIEKQDIRIQQQQKESDVRFKLMIEALKEAKKQSVNITEEEPVLSPKEFKEYLELNSEEREAFRKLHPSYSNLPK